MTVCAEAAAIIKYLGHKLTLKLSMCMQTSHYYNYMIYIGLLYIIYYYA